MCVMSQFMLSSSYFQVRRHVLAAGKTLLTPQPRLRTGFFSTLSAADLPEGPGSLLEACTSAGVAKWGQPSSLNDALKVDMIVVGSSAVSANGARLGKGEVSVYDWGEEQGEHRHVCCMAHASYGGMFCRALAANGPAQSVTVGDRCSGYCLLLQWYFQSQHCVYHVPQVTQTAGQFSAVMSVESALY